MSGRNRSDAQLIVIERNGLLETTITKKLIYF
jgi:hypothetical protein